MTLLQPERSGAFRCSVASLDATEPLEGTASTVGTFLLVESAGPWGVDALTDGRLDTEVQARLIELQTRGVRPLLLRRPGRRPGQGSRIRVFTARTTGALPRLESAELTDPRELLDLDLARLAAGGSAGLAEHDGPLFLACTHGRHDACCAELGRPMAAALAAAAPDASWEVSHVGGDRFAPNVVVLPHGLYYGRLLPAEAEQLVQLHWDGRLDLEHLRGRSSYPFAVQAAEIQLRRRLDLDVIGALPLLKHTRDGEVTSALFAAGEEQWWVRVHTTRSAPTRLTCRSTSDSTALRHTLLDLVRREGTDDPE